MFTRKINCQKKKMKQHGMSYKQSKLALLEYEKKE